MVDIPGTNREESTEKLQVHQVQAFGMKDYQLFFSIEKARESRKTDNDNIPFCIFQDFIIHFSFMTIKFIHLQHHVHPIQNLNYQEILNQISSPYTEPVNRAHLDLAKTQCFAEPHTSQASSYMLLTTHLRTSFLSEAVKIFNDHIAFLEEIIMWRVFVCQKGEG